MPTTTPEIRFEITALEFMAFGLLAYLDDQGLPFVYT